MVIMASGIAVSVTSIHLYFFILNVHNLAQWLLIPLHQDSLTFMRKSGNKEMLRLVLRELLTPPLPKPPRRQRCSARHFADNELRVVS